MTPDDPDGPDDGGGTAPPRSPTREPTAKEALARRGDPTLADELDPATVAQLARWFDLPSAEALADAGVEVEDEETKLGRERREAALAAVDPAFMARLERKRADIAELIRFRATLRTRIDPSISSLDPALMARADAISEPREVEIPEPLRDDLRDCTPQALLRDLARPVFDFEIHYERDRDLEVTLDPGQHARGAMATRWRPAPLDTAARLRAGDAERVAYRAATWADIDLPRRRSNA